MKKVILAVMFSMFCTGLSYAAEEIEIKEAWVRETPPGSAITALYMNIENKGSESDTLKAVSTSVSKKAEIHRTLVDEKGVAKMEMMDSVPVPGGALVELKPGGTHIMLIDLTGQVKSGETVEVQLVFERAGQIQVEAKVLGSGDDDHMHHRH